MTATKMKPWADGPFELIQTPVLLTGKHDMWTEGASHMCNVHNATFRGYNSIYHQALHVLDSDKKDFLAYCLAWFKFVDSHAAAEESGLFVMAREFLHDDTVFEDSHHEHDFFHPAVNECQRYLSTLPSPQDLSATRLLELMSRFQNPFESHFRAEIDTIANLANHSHTPEAGSKEEASAKAKFEKWGGSAILGGGLADVTMFFLCNMDRTYEDGLWEHWPPIPTPARWAFINVAGLIHSGWWKFASCDSNGVPKPLYASS